MCSSELQNVLKFRILQKAVEKTTGREPWFCRKGIVGSYLLFQPAKGIYPMGKTAGDFFLQERRIVGKAQGTPGKADLRAYLLVKAELFAGKTELAEQPVQRGMFVPRIGAVGHGVQTGFK